MQDELDAPYEDTSIVDGKVSLLVRHLSRSIMSILVVAFAMCYLLSMGFFGNVQQCADCTPNKDHPFPAYSVFFPYYFVSSSMVYPPASCFGTLGISIASPLGFLLAGYRYLSIGSYCTTPSKNPIDPELCGQIAHKNKVAIGIFSLTTLCQLAVGAIQGTHPLLLTHVFFAYMWLLSATIYLYVQSEIDFLIPGVSSRLGSKHVKQVRRMLSWVAIFCFVHIFVWAPFMVWTKRLQFMHADVSGTTFDKWAVFSVAVAELTGLGAALAFLISFAWPTISDSSKSMSLVFSIKLGNEVGEELQLGGNHPVSTTEDSDTHSADAPSK